MSKNLYTRFLLDFYTIGHLDLAYLKLNSSCITYILTLNFISLHNYIKYIPMTIHNDGGIDAHINYVLVQELLERNTSFCLGTSLGRCRSTYCCEQQPPSKCSPIMEISKEQLNSNLSSSIYITPYLKPPLPGTEYKRAQNSF